MPRKKCLKDEYIGRRFKDIGLVKEIEKEHKKLLKTLKPMDKKYAQAEFKYAKKFGRLFDQLIDTLNSMFAEGLDPTPIQFGIAEQLLRLLPEEVKEEATEALFDKFMHCKKKSDQTRYIG